MKPSPIHYVFAYDLPVKGYLACWAVFGVAVVISECQPAKVMFTDWIYCALFVISLVLAPFLFAFLSLPVAFIFLIPIYYLGDRLAGAPFRVGDHVRILVGPYRHRVVEIYDVWNSRRQIRVRLNPELEREARDVFSFTQVLRESVA